jgi:hypothetical protein
MKYVYMRVYRALVQPCSSLNCSNEPFENAHKAFFATLSSTDRARFRFSACSSPNDIEKCLREMECLSKQSQKRSLNRYLGVFKKLNERLQPYFDALNVIASVGDNVAFAYGAFRIVLQVRTSLAHTMYVFEGLLWLILPLASKCFPDLL